MIPVCTVQVLDFALDFSKQCSEFCRSILVDTHCTVVSLRQKILQILDSNVGVGFFCFLFQCSVVAFFTFVGVGGSNTGPFNMQFFVGFSGLGRRV